MNADVAEVRGVTTDDRSLTVLETVDERVEALPEGSRTRSLELGLLAVGLTCMLLPGALSWLVGGPLALLLAVPDETNEAAGTQRRLLGFAAATAGAYLAYHGDIRPVGFNS